MITKVNYHINKHVSQPKAHLIKPLPGWRDRPHLQRGKGGETNLTLIFESDMGSPSNVVRPEVHSKYRNLDHLIFLLKNIYSDKWSDI